MQSPFTLIIAFMYVFYATVLFSFVYIYFILIVFMIC